MGQLPFHQDWSQEELQRRLTEQIPDLGRRSIQNGDQKLSSGCSRLKDRTTARIISAACAQANLLAWSLY